MTKRGGRIAGVVVLALAVTATVAVITRPQLDAAHSVIRADAALVLSGDVDYLRVKHAAALYGEGAVNALLLTGRGAGGDSAEEMRKVAMVAGVPDAAIVLESGSTSTHENVLFAASLIEARGWKRIALVTSQSHLARAIATARKAMPGVEWIPASVPDAGPSARARRLRAVEALKMLWYKARGWA